MAWTTPKTWVAVTELGAGDLNTYVRDNLLALKTPPSNAVDTDVLASTTSTSFVDVNASTLALAITTAGGNIRVNFVGYGYMSAAGNLGGVTLSLDAVDVLGTSFITVLSTSYISSCSFSWLLTSVAAGAHTVTLRFKTSAGTFNLAHKQFYILEE